MKHRFYYNGFLKKNKDLILNKKKFFHFIILRIKVGDIITLFNGLGGEYESLVYKIDNKKIYIKIYNFYKKNNKLAYKLELVQTVIKNSKMNWIIEKSTELGIHCIQLLKTKFCNINYNKIKFKKKNNNWNNIIVSSLEQCGRNSLMKIYPIINFISWIKLKKKKILLSPNSKLSILNWAKYNYPQNISFAIGPEGGFSKEEENIAKNNNIEILSLGSIILRVETAAITTINILKTIWNII